MNLLQENDPPEVIRTVWGKLEVAPDVLGFPPAAIDIIRYHGKYWTLFRTCGLDNGKLARTVDVHFRDPPSQWGGHHRTLDEAIAFARKYLRDNNG
jgi:hypothetical protein